MQGLPEDNVEMQLFRHHQVPVPVQSVCYHPMLKLHVKNLALPQQVYPGNSRTPIHGQKQSLQFFLCKNMGVFILNFHTTISQYFLFNFLLLLDQV